MIDWTMHNAMQRAHEECRRLAGQAPMTPMAKRDPKPPALAARVAQLEAENAVLAGAVMTLQAQVLVLETKV